MAFSLSQYWMHLDEMGKLVAFLLVAMSLLSWYTLLSKAWTFWRIRRSATSVNAFWNAPNLEDAHHLLVHSDVEKIFTPLASQSFKAVQDHRNGKSLMAKTDLSDVISRVLRQEMNQVTIRLESGLTLLASIGATAPFIGLLGTVWGIYGALNAISGEGTIQIDIVAGPVGEALVMTAMGLMVAIPAVLAYNGFNRINRITLAELDGFAFDLHAHLSKTNSAKAE
jgi:biopolymer transport protein ExbB